MKVTVDTNVLVRAAVRDDKKQSEAAARLLRNADSVVVTLPCLCEFVWVVRRLYGLGREDVVHSIQDLVNASNVRMNRPAVDAGLALLKAGGDFADAVIAHEGKWLGGDTFVSFDNKAVSVLAKQGIQARLLH
jgi:predicted nucleic-acid-binding protein